jgi:hypothetical protein
MIKDGHEFLKWLQRIREEESERAQGMNSREYLALIQKEAEAVLDQAGYKHEPASEGLGNLIVRGEQA